jgi:hypothetical protein
MSGQPQLTLVFYYIPEDKDDLAYPNAFGVPKAIENITLVDIEQAFPLSGEFIFRFKYKVGGQSVWLDLNNKKCLVPKCDNRIIMKVTRKVEKRSKTQACHHLCSSPLLGRR